MDQTDHSIVLYSAQAEPVLEALHRDGVCFSKASYVRRKYQESSPLFLTAYGWVIREAAAYVVPPEGAEFPYWAFENPYSVEASGTVQVLKLKVPLDQVILFDLYDWNRILQLQLLSASEDEERCFKNELKLRGITACDVMLGDFYPELKQQIFRSWQRLFRHHNALLRGDRTSVGGVQAALWQIRAEWIC